jgi:hypothetical protein
MRWEACTPIHTRSHRKIDFLQNSAASLALENVFSKNNVCGQDTFPLEGPFMYLHGVQGMHCALTFLKALFEGLSHVTPISVDGFGIFPKTPALR